MGRAKQFNEAEVLHKAMLTFWEFGYEKTSVRMLEERMEINQFSIYATFQSKEDLFRRVLQHYSEYLEREFLGALTKSDCKLKDVEEFLLKFAGAIIQKKIPNGCLMVYSTADLDLFDQSLHRIVSNYFGNMANYFRHAVANSIAARDLPEDTELGPTIEFLTGLTQSISIYGKIRSMNEIERYVRFALGKLK